MAATVATVAGFVCADGTVTGSVDEVDCESGICTASVLGQEMSIHETGPFIKAWCVTRSHVKAERMDTSVCSGRGGPEDENIQTLHLDVSRYPINL